MNLFNNSGADLADDIEETADDTSVDSPAVETDEVDNVEELESGELEESESEENSNDDEDSEEDGDIFVIDGEEFTREQLENAKDVENTKKHLQAAWTKKTMALSDERKATESERDSLSNLAAELQVLVNEDGEVDWKELKEYEPDEYIKRKELADSRVKKLEEAKLKLQPKTELSPEELKQEQTLMFDAFPEWVTKDDNGHAIEVTPQYQKDINAISKHAKELGFTDEQLSKVNTSSMVKALMNSMKFGEKKSKIEIVKKKTKPKQSKPAKAGQASQPTSLFNKSVK